MPVSNCKLLSVALEEESLVLALKSHLWEEIYGDQLCVGQYIFVCVLSASYFLLQGIKARILETLVMLILLALLILGIVWVASALIDNDAASMESLYGTDIFITYSVVFKNIDMNNLQFQVLATAANRRYGELHFSAQQES